MSRMVGAVRRVIAMRAKTLACIEPNRVFCFATFWSEPRIPHPVRWGTRFLADRICRSEFAIVVTGHAP
jgi:hypothetical protein